MSKLKVKDGHVELRVSIPVEYFEATGVEITDFDEEVVADLASYLAGYGEEEKANDLIWVAIDPRLKKGQVVNIGEYILSYDNEEYTLRKRTHQKGKVFKSVKEALDWKYAQ